MKKAMISYPFKNYRIHIVGNKKVGLLRRYSARNLFRRLQAEKSVRLERTVVRTVEHCRSIIKNELSDFITDRQKDLGFYVTTLLDGRSSLDDSLLQEIVGGEQLNQVLGRISHMLQNELQRVFGVASMELAGFRADQTGVDLVLTLQLVREYRLTITTGQVINKLADQVWEDCLANLGLSLLVEKAVKKLDLPGAVFGNLGCRPDQLRSRREQQILHCLQGLVTNVGNRITAQLCEKSAHVFYGIFDQLLAAAIEDNAPILKSSTETLADIYYFDVTTEQQAG